MAALILVQRSRYGFWPKRKSVILEVVRAAYKAKACHVLPESRHLDDAESYLQRSFERESVITELVDSLAANLGTIVNDETYGADDYPTPSGLMGRLTDPRPGFFI